MKKIFILMIMILSTLLVACKTTTTTTSTTVVSSVDEVYIKGLTITQPNKTIYNVGESLDLTGFEVKKMMSDGSVIPLDANEYQLSGFNSSTPGVKSVTITYQTFTRSFLVTINQVVVEEPKDDLTEVDQIDYKSGHLYIHYHRFEGDYSDWALWLWSGSKAGSLYSFTMKNDYGAVIEIDLNNFQDATEIGLIVRKKSLLNGQWVKDVSSDRFIDLTKVDTDGSVKAFLVQGKELITSNASEQDLEDPFKNDDGTKVSYNDLNGIVYDKVATSNKFKQNASIGYQIMVVAYADGYHVDGYGDLKGVIDNLDYIKNVLNVDVIWLTPINPSNSYHKYDVNDYYSIDSKFGTMSDFEILVQEIHNRDMYLVMDYVINHTSLNNEWFKKAALFDDEYRNFYNWVKPDNLLKYSNKGAWYLLNNYYYFASFWSGMPELNYDSQAVRDEIVNIAKYWLDLGVDGFRIDAAKHLYDPAEFAYGSVQTSIDKNVSFFKEFNARIKESHPDAFIVGEVWAPQHETAQYYEGMDSLLNFDFASSIISAINSGNSNNISGLYTYMNNAFSENRSDYIDSFFLTNHDQQRLINNFNLNVDKAKLAANILLTMPGISWIYYGEELGMSGVGSNEASRQPFKWANNSSYNTNGSYANGSAWDNYNRNLPSKDAQLLDENSLLKLYSNLTNLKANNDVIKYGTFSDLDTNSKIYAYLRSYNGETYIIAHNLTGSDVTFTSDSLTSSSLIYNRGAVINQNSCTLSPYSSVVLKVSDTNITLN